MKQKLPYIIFWTILFCFFNPIIIFGQTTETFTSSGSFKVPAGVTSLKVEAWGAGGAGGAATINKYSGGGGGGGAYSIINTVEVTAGQIINYTVGSGGTGGNIR